jgi:hypothetical protein
LKTPSNEPEAIPCAFVSPVISQPVASVLIAVLKIELLFLYSTILYLMPGIGVPSYGIVATILKIMGSLLFDLWQLKKRTAIKLQNKIFIRRLGVLCNISYKNAKSINFLSFEKVVLEK